MNNLEKEINIKQQLKLAKVFKAVVSAGIIAPVFVSVSACEKAKPVVETTAQAPKTTIASTTTVAETTTTVEPTTTTEAIINAPEIASLKFDQTTKTYIAEVGNPYGLKEGAEAGVYTKEAIKVNGEMEDAIGLKPAVIDYFQKQYQKNSDCFFPLIINLNEVKGVEIEESNISDDQNIDWLGVKIPEGVKLYAPLTTKDTIYTSDANWFQLDFFAKNKKERIMGVGVYSRKQYSIMDSKKEIEDQGWAKVFDLKEVN